LKFQIPNSIFQRKGPKGPFSMSLRAPGGAAGAAIPVSSEAAFFNRDKGDKRDGSRFLRSLALTPENYQLRLTISSASSVISAFKSNASDGIGIFLPGTGY
jgi:hypothetical protein